MVGAVGIGLRATLKIRKLLILLNAKNAKNTGFAQPRYTRGTRLQWVRDAMQIRREFGLSKRIVQRLTNAVTKNSIGRIH
jgi:hypothetical protein